MGLPWDRPKPRARSGRAGARSTGRLPGKCCSCRRGSLHAATPFTAADTERADSWARGTNLAFLAGIGRPCPSQRLLHQAGTQVTWTTDLRDFRRFSDRLCRCPWEVYLSGILNGRRASLTAATINEEVDRFWVRSAAGGWTAVVSRDGRKMAAVLVKRPGR